MHRTAVRRFLVLGATCALTLVLGVNAALAGEVTGNGKSLKNEDGHLNGKSECAFSGLNDTYSGDPTVPDDDGFFRTQNWGQIGSEGRAFLTSIQVSPRYLCNPTGGGAGAH
ncbi:MAG TPA: hypothetical protein VFR14_00435 [Candidatus Limnocylindrales bacterium]|nr:hypothetical protein [Candidatus Limnocylindrales bacterium]